MRRHGFKQVPLSSPKGARCDSVMPVAVAKLSVLFNFTSRGFLLWLDNVEHHCLGTMPLAQVVLTRSGEVAEQEQLKLYDFPRHLDARGRLDRAAVGGSFGVRALKIAGKGSPVLIKEGQWQGFTIGTYQPGCNIEVAEVVPWAQSEKMLTRCGPIVMSISHTQARDV